jgi:CubicO group peptidase (beta-lactamase class C family)
VFERYGDGYGPDETYRSWSMAKSVTHALIGMQTATPRFDAAGTFIGSSYLFASARDFARFGLFYLRDGTWDGERILPEGWVDHARTTTPGSEGEYGAHWWLRLAEEDSFHCSGFQGQYILCSPSRDLVVVRLGVSTPEQREPLIPWFREVLSLFD